MSLSAVGVFAVAPVSSPLFSYLGSVLAKWIDKEHGTILAFLAVFTVSIASLLPTVAYHRFFSATPAHLNHYLKIFSVFHVLAFIMNTLSWSLVALYQDQTLKKQASLEDVKIGHFCAIAYISEAVAAVIAAVVSLFYFGATKLKGN